MAPRYTYGEGPSGSSCLSIGLTALPCPGVALRLSTVIDCAPGKDRMPPVTIDFLKNPPPQLQSEADDTEAPEPAPASAVVAVQFTCNSGDFVLFSQLERVEAMVAAAGLPRECAPSVDEFFSLSASHATNSFYKAMAITVEAGAPGIVVDEYEDVDEEVPPPGAAVEECAICCKEYLVGGATAVKLPMCSHTFHRKCMDRWTAVKRTCPCCRAPVPEEEQDYWDEDDYSDSESEDEYEYDVHGEEEGSSSSPVVPDGGNQEVTAVFE